MKDNLYDHERLENVSIEELKDRAGKFYEIMDWIVFQFQQESESHVKWMMIVEAELSIFSLLIVILEIFFIVNPIIKRIVVKKKLSEILGIKVMFFLAHQKSEGYAIRVTRESNPERQKNYQVRVRELDALSEVSEICRTH